jgi:hypothetical protein
MANSETGPAPEKAQFQFDSLNMDTFEPTDVVDDSTIRPMPDSMRKSLRLPPYGPPPQQPFKENPSA